MRNILAIAGLTAIIQGFIPTIPAKAHFPQPSPAGWNEWAVRQYSLGGNRCCDESDSYLYTDSWTYEYDQFDPTRISGVRITLLGKEISVDRTRLVDHRGPRADDANPTGNAVVWYRVTDSENVFCFDPTGPLV